MKQWDYFHEKYESLKSNEDIGPIKIKYEHEIFTYL